MEIAAHVELVRLRAEEALLHRLNAGFGFADARIPAETFLRDPEARARLGNSALRPRGTHQSELDTVRALLAAAESSRARANPSRLDALCARLGLDAARRSILEIAIVYALDIDVRQLCQALCGGRAPALYTELLLELCPGLSETALRRALHEHGTLRQRGLVTLVRDTLIAEDRVVSWVLGEERIAGPLASIIAIDAQGADLEVHICDEVRRCIETATSLAQGGTAIVLKGGEGAGKRAAAHAIARDIGCDLLAVSLHDVRELSASRGSGSLVAEVLAEATLRHAVPYLAGVEALDGDRIAVQAIDRHPGTVILTTRAPGLVTLPCARPFHLISISPSSLETRRTAWNRFVDEHTAAQLGARYVVGPGVITEVIADARRFALAEQRELHTRDVEASLSRKLSASLGPLATRVTRRARMADMILPDDALTTLRDMIAMVRARSTILEDWGYAEHLGMTRGVSALFSGRPGTGKTMAASVVASELGLELFRVDLSSVVSKWVGETEKHLARIFDEAEHAEAMVLFDEADSLFGKRTDVSSSSDRYANLEVNYLLQRMENFNGISVLTTNHESAIDGAFLRRLNFRARFPDPETEERELLWRALLPPGTGLAESVDFTELARQFDMTGGHIRNVIVRAAVIAARTNRPMKPEDLTEAAHLEYYEMGKVLPSLSKR